MRDNELIQIFLPVLKAGLIERGYTDVTVKQANQPTQQGAVKSPVVYFQKLNDKRYGYPERKSFWDEGLQKMRHIERQFYENTYQFNGFVINDPAALSYTASDLCNTAAAVLQSDKTIDLFNAQNVGVLRVQDVRAPYVVDDYDRFELSPSFDLIFTTETVFESDDIYFTTYDYAIYPI